MTNKEKVEVSYSRKKTVCFRDFGLFEGEAFVEVEKDFWNDYVEARYKFELLHIELEKKVNKN